MIRRFGHAYIEDLLPVVDNLVFTMSMDPTNLSAIDILVEKTRDELWLRVG